MLIPLIKTVFIAVLLICIQEVQGQVIDTLLIKIEADNIKMLGDSLRHSSKFPEAINMYESALKKYRQIGDSEGAAETLNDIGILYYHEDNLTDALIYYRKAAAMYRDFGDLRRLYKILNKIGMLYKAGSEYLEALNAYEEGLEISKELGDKKTEATLLNNIGDIHRKLSEYPEALTALNESMRISEEIGDKNSKGCILNSIGILYMARSDYRKALDAFMASLDIAKEIGDRKLEASVLHCVGVYFTILKDHSTAMDYCHRSLEITRDLGDKIQELEILNSIGYLYSRLYDYHKAMEYYQQTLELIRKLGIRKKEAYVLDNIGIIYTELSDYNNAVDYYRQSMKLFRESGDKVGECLLIVDLVKNYFKQEKFSEAVENIENGLEIADKLDIAELQRLLLNELGQCFAAQGKDSLAVIYFRAAIRATEDIRRNLKFEGEKNSFTGGVTNIYQGFVLSSLRLKHYKEAYNYVERSKARSFLDMLACSDLDVGKNRHAEFFQKEQELQEQKAELEAQIAAEEDTLQVAELRGKLEEEWQSIDALIDEKKQYEPELASMVTVNPLTLQEVQDQMDPKSAILEYLLTEEKTFVWLVTPKELEVYQVEVGGDSIATLVRGFRDAIVAGSNIEHRSRQLYDLLISPAEDNIRTKDLVIIPHGVLHYLPFQALQNQKGKYLIDRYHINYLPSASVMKYLEPKKRSKGETLLVLGNPATQKEEYKSLPFAEQEVNQIAEFYKQHKLLIGEAATEDEFRELAPQYDILHLACHSELNSAYPLFSGLLLAPGEEQDGELDVHEIFTMDLNADLIVLSACQTGLGHLTNGDELVGLSRAFIYAGTPTVLSSLWTIQDESTAYLMTEFYKNLKKYSKAEALRRAQRSTKKKYPSPYHWASFVLIGDPG